MSKLIITRGLPASGKTTWAKAWVAEDPDNRVRVNRDDLRTMVNDAQFSHVSEEFIIEARDNLIKSALKKGKDVVNDDTNLKLRVARDLRKLAEFQNAEFEIMEFTDVDVETCARRDYFRGFNEIPEKEVGRDVIYSMYNRYLKGRGSFLPWPSEPNDDLNHYALKPYNGTPGKPKTVIFDIDGTLANKYEHRDIYDVSQVYLDHVIEPIARMANHLHDLGYEIVFMSGRRDDSRRETRNWLRDKVGAWTATKNLFMRKTGDKRRDSVVKLELFDKYVRDNYDVHYSFDDRYQVVSECWRAMGITCLQVADGDF